ncbi:spore germination protein GerPE [Fictibacillus phosphorivorans]|uniref:spore germination protein GerPE n=1 Tax=Fictibacillus phosphorivorans TaxID=1221500 RepID=UPI00203CD451|nr:spore germination protein GerPE [Fictibacillus phosphorivorans]MCM3720165.1 spore germination protein GerPE [Fictibacillus phosphorivorans]MCM3777855.1 spore germination protein GerPE [Fictibacillus phosphorivorans]
MYRTSAVDGVLVNSVQSASILHTGDTEKVQCFSAALAIQRERTDYGTFDVPLNKYEIFSEPVVVPVCPNVQIKRTFNACPFIRVGRIDILGISSSSLLHIGSVNEMTLQSRVKHIRNFLTNPYPENGEEEES